MTILLYFTLLNYYTPNVPNQHSRKSKKPLKMIKRNPLVNWSGHKGCGKRNYKKIENLEAVQEQYLEAIKNLTDTDAVKEVTEFYDKLKLRSIQSFLASKKARSLV